MVRDRWEVKQRVAGGAFGQIFLAIDHDKDNKEVALKIEPIEDNPLRLLRVDSAVIKRFQNSTHCPRLIGMGHVEDKFMYLVMELLGKDLMTIREESRTGLFSIPTAFAYFRQAVEALQDFHNIGWIHRDVKPNNLMMGLGENKDRVYLIDYGLARRIQEQDGSERKKRTFACFRGSLRYASPNIHDGNEMGRHDDLYSLMFVLVEWITGNLPWIAVSDRELIGRLKRETSTDALCKGLPEETKLILDHIKSLSYSKLPDYAWILKTVDKILNKYDTNSPAPESPPAAHRPSPNVCY